LYQCQETEKSILRFFHDLRWNFFRKKIVGQGITASLLMENGVKVISEKDVSSELLEKLINTF
jgi:hypothetical protein